MKRNMCLYICVYNTQMKTDFYSTLIQNLPADGRHINAHVSGTHILVYQAYRPSIAEYALHNQRFGGADFSFSRMSWIKTSFLWMMYRSGWAQKPGQEKVLGIWLPLHFFDKILEITTVSSYSKEFHTTKDTWKAELQRSESRLQWDPDHDPHGKPIARKAIQLGLKGSLLNEFTANTTQIEDFTPFVKEQHALAVAGDYRNLKIPVEACYVPQSILTRRRIGLNEM